MKVFNLPDLGEGLPDAEIQEWHVKEGDEVKTGDTLVSLETAKAIVDVPSPRNGKILKLYGKASDVILTGKPLVEFEDGEEAGTVVGQLSVSNTVLEEAAAGISPQTSSVAIKAMPAVRALAKKLNIDLARVTPSGPQGQITLDDVEKASHDVALTGVRRSMANTMSHAHAEVVPATIFDDADIHHWPQGTDATVRLIRAVIVACQAEPSLNAHYDGKAMHKHLFDVVNLGLAMDAPDGLLVPVIKDAGQFSDEDLRKYINELKLKLKDRSFSLAELQDSTIMLSNFGTFAGRYATPVVVPPNVAILGAGRAREQIVAVQGQPAVHRVLPLSLSFDHRAVTGGEASRFLAAVIRALET